MRSYPSHCSKIIVIAISFALAAGGYSFNALALDFLPDFLKDTKISRHVWKMQEQYVALAPWADKKSAPAPKNQHPVILDVGEVRDALLSLELWIDGGFFRDEEAVRVFSSAQVTAMVRYVVEGLSQAKANEDVVFNIGGYGSVAADIVKERYWTAGRIFYSDDKLNVIIGTYKVKKDRGVRQVEGAHGILNDYSDVQFNHGNRNSVAKMPGRISTTAGVALNSERGRERPDWVQIDVSAAALGHRNSLIPDEDKKRDAKVKQEAAKLTVERRQMREEMARLRKELGKLKRSGRGASGLEDRLATLKKLKEKQLISDDEFEDRRRAILEEI